MKTLGQLEGREVVEATLSHGNQAVRIMNYGCAVRSWRIDLGQEVREIVLGLDNVEDYPRYSPDFGIIAGRVANRVCNGRFLMNGDHYQLDCNEGRHHLHGGSLGLGKRLWDLQSLSGNSVELRIISSEGDQGYPAEIEFCVRYTLNETGLHCDMAGFPSALTPINLAQHNYYNLSGCSNIAAHRLRLTADHYLPVDKEMIPTGELAVVDGTPFDFRSMRSFRSHGDDGPGEESIVDIDHNFVLSRTRDLRLPAALLSSPTGDLSLGIITDQPGMQVYTGSKLNVPVPGLSGNSIGPFGGVCLEPQHFPDSLNQPGFPSILCSPDTPYKQRLTMQLQSA